VLTTIRGRAYNPATERGAAETFRVWLVPAPVKLLTKMSELTAGGYRLLFVVEWDLRRPSFK
jgi:hypothetical protein